MAKKGESKITKFQTRIVLGLFVILAVMVFVLCLYTGINMKTLSDYMYKDTEERLLSISKYAATLVTEEELDMLIVPEDIEKPLFYVLKQRLINFAESNDVLYVYYARNNEDNMYQYIIDNDISDETVNLTTEPLEWEEKPLQALYGHASATELENYSVGYNNLISAFAPIYGKYGSVIAVAGVDIDDRHFLAIRTTMNRLVPLLSGGVLIITLCGLLMVLLHRKSDRERLIALNEALLANQTKTTFLANMSHEMRTPLNAIIGLSDLVLGAEIYGEEERTSIEKVYSAGKTLLYTVNDILDISKIGAGKLEIIPVDYDLPSLLNDTITQSIMFVNEKPIQFVLDIDENLPLRLFGDELRVKQILNNLLSNAFKYTKEGLVKLSARCTREGDKTVLLIVSVRDTGIGIKPENISSVFEDYAQVDALANRKIMGTGLGMPLTKRLVELMGGTINVESVYGKGSTFTVQIPQEFVTDKVISSEIVENLRSFHYTNNKRQRVSGQNRVKLPYAHVLVVDDVQTNLDVSKGLMKPYGMKIDCMASGQEAIDAVRTGLVKYNAIFMDHMMPGMDGIEATRIIREEIGTEYAKTVPIIALTANAIVGNEEMFLQHGFQAFLSKPIDIGKLDIVIKNWVRDKEKEKQYAEEHPQTEEAGEDTETKNNEQNKLKAKLFKNVIAGLDVEKGLSLFGGDAESYIIVLQSFLTNTPALLESIKNVSRANLADYGITAHGIKGSSRGIGASAIGDMAEALEKAAKTGDYDYIISHNEALQEAVWKFLPELTSLLSKINSDGKKPLQDKPDTAVLSKLLAACNKYDLDGVEAAMSELLSFNYKADSELVDWLKKNTQLMNLQEIIEKLSGMPGVIEK